MNDHVAKPIEPEELWKALLKWIKPRHPAQVPATVSPRAAALGDLPSGIDGLDMTGGLRRVLGKKPLYVSMLRKFVAGQKSAAPAIVGALDATDWGRAERLAHTLKGVSGNIGAAGIQRLAEELETAIREREPRGAVDARLAGLSKCLLCNSSRRCPMSWRERRSW